MGFLDGVRSRLDDANRRIEELQRSAVDSAKAAVHAADTTVKENAQSVADSATNALQTAEQQGRDIVDAAKNAAKGDATKTTASLPSMAAPHVPRVPGLPAAPRVLPGVGEQGSTVEQLRPYVMIGAGVGTAYVTGHLGPAGAVGQYAIDAAVHEYGTAQDKFNFGYGQLGGAYVVGAQGAVMAGEGGTAEISTGGLATPIAVPIAAVGAIQVAVAATQVAGAQGLISAGAAGAPPAPAAVTPTPGRFASQRLLDRHFDDHASEWPGTITKDEYEAKARALMSKPVGGDILGHTRPNGDTLRYDKSTNEFGVMTSDGTIRTIFRPTRGLAYWNDEVAP